MENERKTIDCRPLRAGFGSCLPPGFFDPLERAQSGLDAALVEAQNQQSATQSPGLWGITVKENQT